MPASFTRKIYSKWMRDAQLVKYEDIFLQFILPLSQKLDFKKLKIIDIGIGPGWFEQELEQRLGIGLDVVGIDLENIDNKLVKMVIADANNIPFKPTSFDFIFCLDSVHLIKRPGAMLRLLRPEGHLLISSFCSRYTAMEKRKEILRFFSKAKLLKESVVGDPKLEMSYVALFKYFASSGQNG